MQKKHIILFIAFLILFNITIFGDSLGYDFVEWDDYTYLSDNRLIKSLSFNNIKEIFTSSYFSNYTPFILLSFSFEYFLCGTAPFIYHTTNLLFHIFNNILVFWLIFKLSNNFLVSFICAILFGIHPLHVESIVWISERKDVISTFFFLLSIISYLYYRNNYRKIYYFSLLFFICALLSKPMVITLPFLLILCDYYFYRSFNKKYLLNKIPFFILSFIFSIITIVSVHKGEAIRSQQLTSIYENILIAIKGIVFYLEKTVLPINLSSFYPYPKIIRITSPSFFIPLIILSVIIFLVYFSRKFTKKIIFASLFFIITILPVLNLIPIGGVSVADRYMYIPSIGLFFMAGIAFKWIYYKKMRWDKLKKISIFLILFMAVVSYSILTVRRNSVWKDGESLWLDVLKKYPEVCQAHNNLGVFYDKKKGMTDKAISEFKKALKINPNYSDCYYNLGFSYEKKGMTDEAIAAYKKAIEINPNFPKAHGHLGFIYIDNKMSSLGADHLYKAGLLFLKQGDKKSVLKAYKGLKLTESEELQKALFKKLYPDVK